MTAVEYNDMIEDLYHGHELEFKYNSTLYYLERCENTHELYKIIDNDEGILIKTIEGADLIKRTEAFLDMPLFDNKSFNQLIQDIEILNID